MPNNETLADTLAEFRKFALRAAEEDKMISPESVLLLADKVEAAAQRKKVEAEAAKDARNRVAVRLREEYAEKCKECKAKSGNAAALRETLWDILDIVNGVHHEEQTPNSVRDRIRELVYAADAAPPRNCDVGTAEEQEERFDEFCSSHFKHCSKCPLFDKFRFCQAAWMQMPYEKEGAPK